jgi:hypothetical protein
LKASDTVKILQTIAASGSATLAIALFYAIDERLSEFELLIGVAVGIFVYIMIDKLQASAQNEKRIAREEENKRFENGEMTPAERKAYVKRKIDFAEMAYRHGDLTLLQLEALKKKYTGESFYIDNYGLEVTAATSNMDQVDRAIAQHKKDADRNLIINAAVGDAIGGTAGAIVGAAASARKSAQEAADLERQRATADRDFHRAIENSFKR